MRALLILLLLLMVGSARAADWYVPLPPKRGEGGTVYALVDQTALRHGVPPALARAITKVESRGRCHASSGIAHGAMQVRPATARGVGVHGNLYHCATGIEAGVRYLKQALARARGSWAGAATLYNRGLGARPVASGYSRKVLAAAE